uniref:Pyr_redox_2 domain-containing protein n=1 Tax=Panagrellus redivivus TaxID=6233 RepID=A0A7E4VNQ9_PANRE
MITTRCCAPPATQHMVLSVASQTAPIEPQLPSTFFNPIAVIGQLCATRRAIATGRGERRKASILGPSLHSELIRVFVLFPLSVHLRKPPPLPTITMPAHIPINEEMSHIKPHIDLGETYADNLDLDVLIVGAGFSGVYLLYKLRQAGFKVKVYDASHAFGGVWRWNCYPGARVDSDLPAYEFSLPEVYKNWTWKERFPGWQELQEYFDYCDHVLDLRKDVSFNTVVNGAQFDRESGKWVVTTEDGRTAKAKYLLPCVGFAAKRYVPDWKGLDTFKGEIHHSSFWPTEDVDVSGKRTAVIGTGSTGIQIIQEWAKASKELTVFQRTPNMSIKMGQRKVSAEEQQNRKHMYPELFKKRTESFGGFCFDFVNKKGTELDIAEANAFLQSLWDNGDFTFWVGTFSDIFKDQVTNKIVYDFWRSKVVGRLNDPAVAELLAPKEPPHPWGCKRPSLEQDFYDQFNKPNVHLVSVKHNPIVEIKPNGIVTADGKLHEVDVIAVATGFDAVTGSMINMNLKNTEGTHLRDLWKDGVRTYLGLAMKGFPNMFFPYGPQAPTTFVNGPTLIELQSDWIIEVIKKAEQDGVKYIEAEEKPQEEWASHICELADKTLFPLADSWYMGANIPGKKREMISYLGGLPAYTQTIEENRKNGLPGFKLVKE